MALLNARFTEVGSKPGFALGWNVQAETALERVADFDDRELGALGLERFGWWDLVEDLSSFAFAIFDTGVSAGEAFEDFDEGFVDPPYLVEWSQGFEEEAPFSPDDFDWGAVLSGSDTAPDSDFDISGYITLWSLVSVTDAASFNGPTATEIFNNWTAL